MSLSHHESNEQSELMKLFQEQRAGQAQRKWPDGRLNGSDDGELAYMIGSDANAGIVQIQFPKPVTVLGLNPQDAINLAQSLIKHARSIAKEPIKIVLH